MVQIYEISLIVPKYLPFFFVFSCQIIKKTLTLPQNFRKNYPVIEYLT